MAALAFGALNVSYGDDTNGVAVLIRDVKKLNRVVSMIANRLGTQNQRLPGTVGYPDATSRAGLDEVGLR